VLPLTIGRDLDRGSGPLCAASDPAGSALDTVEPIASYALPNVPGKRITIMRVFYGPGGFTTRIGTRARLPPTSPRAEIRSQLAGGPVEIFKVGQSFLRTAGRDAPGLGQRQQ